MSRMYCTGCKKTHSDWHWRSTEGKKGWQCRKWFTGSVSVPQGVETRASRPDGTIASGLEGIRILDARMKAQEQGEKHSILTSHGR